MTTRNGHYVLGLRLGCASLGWAALSLDGNGKPCAVLGLGARKFPVGASGEIDSGRESSLNTRRRQARGARVRLARRVARLRALWSLLEGAGYLPSGPFKERDRILKVLDGVAYRAPYKLRAKGLDEPLLPHELGRALYHLAQRRGFQSSRKASQSEKEEEELGVVKQGISDLEKTMVAARSRTLGEHLSRLDGRAPTRRRWTSRAMLRSELALLCAAQRPYHPGLTEKFEKKLSAVMFTQKKAGSQSFKIGRCDLEPSRRRCQLAGLDAQEFRVLCRVNDLRLVDDVGALEVNLTAEQRGKLLDLLKSGDAMFARVRKILGLPKTVRFNAERIDDEKLIGFRTEGRLEKALGELWAPLSRAEQSLVVDDLLNIDDDDGLRRRLGKRFEKEQVEKLFDVALEPGTSALSHKAVSKLLPLLRSGVAYAAARKTVYPTADHHTEVEKLPLVQEAYPHLSNPLVARALSELRVVVGALVKHYGRPKSIVVSLMRELRLGKKARERIWVKNRVRSKERALAKARVLKDLGVKDPPHWMVDKILLADECGWTCPFTGKVISMRSLLGGQAQFEAVHIVPFHQSLDDSFENKTLCHVSKLSGLRSVDPKGMRQVEVQGRFEKMVGPYAKEKLRRVKLSPEEISAEFSLEVVAGRFIDSCYASKLAIDYLSRLYPHTQAAVTATRGAITSYVREGCGLSRLDLPSGSHKKATLDAVCVALSGPSMVRKVSSAANRALPGKRRLNPEAMIPWPSLVEDVQNRLETVIVSPRVRRKVSGALHEETFYRFEGEIKGKKVYSVRKHLWQLSQTDVALIEGREVQEAVQKKLDELGQADPRKAFAKKDALPTYRGTILRRVRITRTDTLFSIGQKPNERHVAVERNHHAAVFLRPSRGGKMLADRVVVSQFEAQERLVKRRPAVTFPDGATAVEAFRTLSVGETLDCTAFGAGYQTVRCVSKDPSIVLTRLEDGRKLTDIQADGARIRMSVEQLRIKGAKKVTVTPLGELRQDGT